MQIKDDDYSAFKETKRILSDKVKNNISSALFNTGEVLATYYGTYLKLDNFKHDITDFHILPYLTLPNWTTQIAGEHPHTHTVNNPFLIKTGDRVIVSRIGNECVVIGKVD